MGDRELLLIKHARCCTDVIRLRWRQERVNARQGVADTVHGVVNCFMHGIILGELLPIWSHMASYSSVCEFAVTEQYTHICLSALPIMTSSRNTATRACGKSHGFSFSPYWIKNSVYFRFLKFTPPFFNSPVKVILIKIT